MDDTDKAGKLLRNLARRLEIDGDGVSASILEGLDEMLTATQARPAAGTATVTSLHQYRRERHGHDLARLSERKMPALAFDGPTLGGNGHAGGQPWASGR